LSCALDVSAISSDIGKQHLDLGLDSKDWKLVDLSSCDRSTIPLPFRRTS